MTTRIFRILFLVIFACNWVPRGGAVVRFPTLDRMLERIDKEYSPKIAKEIRCHSSPSAMCGVKATITKNANALLDFTQSHEAPQSAMIPIDRFVLKADRGSSLLLKACRFISLAIPRVVHLPPPKLLT